MWILLTGIIADQIDAHLGQEKLLPEEQKECRKGSRGSNDLLNIDRAVIKEVKSRNVFLFVSKEYIRRLRKVLKSKLNGGNLI